MNYCCWQYLLVPFDDLRMECSFSLEDWEGERIQLIGVWCCEKRRCFSRRADVWFSKIGELMQCAISSPGDNSSMSFRPVVSELIVVFMKLRGVDLRPSPPSNAASSAAIRPVK